uniref:SWIM-type domain-containing protein n=1 Tax=Oryza sativa subsp. japonica TaxID=39947 RepID=Q7Y1I8_ORYSJ|nr:hypothetical protein [Oryza sativa Japonica Group]
MECTCFGWQHTGKPCQYALAFLTTQRNVYMNLYINECYSVERFKAAYQGEICPMTDKSQWPKVDNGFVLHPPVCKRSAGRHRKVWIKGCLENGAKKRKRKTKRGNTSGGSTSKSGPRTPKRSKASTSY